MGNTVMQWRSSIGTFHRGPKKSDPVSDVVIKQASVDQWGEITSIGRQMLILAVLPGFLALKIVTMAVLMVINGGDMIMSMKCLEAFLPQPKSSSRLQNQLPSCSPPGLSHKDKKTLRRGLVERLSMILIMLLVAGLCSMLLVMAGIEPHPGPLSDTEQKNGAAQKDAVQRDDSALGSLAYQHVLTLVEAKGLALRFLGISKVELSKIVDVTNPDHSEMIMKILHSWKTRIGDDATAHELYHYLTQIDLPRDQLEKARTILEVKALGERPLKAPLSPQPRLCDTSSPTSDRIAELENELEEMYIKTKGHINLDPSDPSFLIKIKDIYVELELESIDNLQQQRISLKSIIEAFGIVGETDRICLFSEAGGGKTVQTQLVAYLWASEGALREKYKLVFLLKLSGLTHKDDYLNLIETQILNHEEPLLKKFITENKKDILFILDGLDEMSTTSENDAPGLWTIGHLLQDGTANVLISTRPSRLSAFLEKSKISTKLEIMGLSEQNARLLIQRHCTYRNITFDFSTAPPEDVIMADLESKNFTSICRNPQQLQMLCQYMQSHKEVSKSMTMLYKDFFKTIRTNFLRLPLSTGRPEIQEIQALIKKDADWQKMCEALNQLALEGFVACKVMYEEHDYEQERGVC